MKLYHSNPYPLVGDTLNPTTKNISLVVDAEGNGRAVFKEYDESGAPYIFATDNKQLSMTYTVPKGVRIGNIHGYRGTEILFLDKEGVIGDPELKGGMYSFESDQFLQAHRGEVPSDQWVSSSPLLLAQAEFTPVQSFNDVMKSGVQIYQIGDREDYDVEGFMQDWDNIRDDADFLRHIQELTQTGKLRWMNEERGINPINGLQEKQIPVSALVPRLQNPSLF